MVKNKKILFLIGLTSILGYHLYTNKVSGEKMKNLDFDLTVKIQDKIPRKYDGILSLFSDLGSVEITSIILLFFIIMAKKIKFGLVTMGSYITGLWIEVLGKNLVPHPGPPYFLLRTEKLIDFPSFYVHTNYSYPSGHSYRSVFLWCLLMVVLWKSSKTKWGKWTWSLVLLALIIIMLVSRVSLGEHWTSDVVGGSLLGVGLGLWSAIFLPTRSSLKPEQIRLRRKNLLD